MPDSLDSCMLLSRVMTTARLITSSVYTGIYIEATILCVTRRHQYVRETGTSFKCFDSTQICSVGSWTTWGDPSRVIKRKLGSYLPLASLHQMVGNTNGGKYNSRKRAEFYLQITSSTDVTQGITSSTTTVVVIIRSRDRLGGYRRLNQR